MNANEYQKLAAVTMNKILDQRSQILNSALGMCGEAGEFADLIKKHAFQGHDLDVNHIKKELGDVCWYVALACTVFNLELDDVMQTNIDKLKARYPEGFSVEKSEHREAGDV